MVDNIKIFGQRLKKVKIGLDKMIYFGIDEELLIAFLCHKMKISRKHALDILRTEEKFFDYLCKKDLAQKIKEDMQVTP